MKKINKTIIRVLIIAMFFACITIVVSTFLKKGQQYSGSNKNVELANLNIQKIDSTTIKPSLISVEKISGIPTTHANSNIVRVSTAIAVKGITLVQKDRTIAVGTSLQLKSTITPTNATNKTITWSSSNSSIATVDKYGVVKGINPGMVTITAKTSNNIIATCIIRVNIPPKSISLNKTDLIMKKGNKATLVVNFNPTNTTSKEVNWKSSNTNVVGVSNSTTTNGQIVITAKANGIATITATHKYGKTATCKIIVNEVVTNSIFTKVVKSISLVQKDCTIAVGTSLQLKSTITPTNATNETITWSSSNSSIATVDKYGVVKGINPGMVTITAKTSNNMIATCIIRVNIPPKSINLNKTDLIMKKGNKATLVVNFNPINTTSKEVNWKSSNTNVVGVSNSTTTNGQIVITAKANGTATITATHKYGKTATCKIIVSDLNELNITNLDIGVQGDCVLLESKGYNLLMDTGMGPNTAFARYVRGVTQDKNKVIKELKNRNVKVLDIYLSHWHQDHYGMIENILKDNYFTIKNIYLPEFTYMDNWKNGLNINKEYNILYDAKGNKINSNGTITYNYYEDAKYVYNMIQNIAKNKKINIITLKRGSKFDIGDASIEIIGPLNTYKIKKTASYVNNYSLVAMCTVGKTRFLTAGDSEGITENDLLDNNIDITADIMKLSHHGNDTSNSLNFIKRVNPKYAFYAREDTLSTSGYMNLSPLSNSIKNFSSLKTNMYGRASNGNLTFSIKNDIISVIPEKNYYTIRIKYIDSSSNKVLSIKDYKFHITTFDSARIKYFTKYYLYDYKKSISGYTYDLQRNKSFIDYGSALNNGQVKELVLYYTHN